MNTYIYKTIILINKYIPHFSEGKWRECKQAENHIHFSKMAPKLTLDGIYIYIFVFK